MKIDTIATLPELHEQAVEAICSLIDKTLANQDVFRISLSGGSTPKRIYELLSERDLPWDKIHFYWGDERNVPHDHDDSNAKMVQAALLDPASVPATNIHTVPVDTDDPKQAALKYEQLLREHFDGQRFPKWDLVLLGMGDDAHTASLFPGTDAIDEKERWFVENFVPKFDAYRYTLTEPAINSGVEKWFLISGENKQQAMGHLLSEELNFSEYPSQLIQPTRWFVTANAVG